MNFRLRHSLLIIEKLRRRLAAFVPDSTWTMAIIAGLLWAASGAYESLMAEEVNGAGGQPWRIAGVGSCTAAGCHGAGHADRVIGSEYNVWISQDPHAQAYSVLFGERSQRMVRLLDKSSGGAVTPAHKDPRCLACHSMTDALPLDNRRDVVSDGVGCEACHGPAEGWLAIHSEHRLSPDERRQYGMWDTRGLFGRAQVCAGCHVGSPGHDVNHDLLAAGHPRLRFEMSAFLEGMAKHWDDGKDRKTWDGRNDRNTGDENFDAKVWALGQAAASQAALAQLADRAEHGKTWPEFAEWSCGACHHDLLGDQQRQARIASHENLSGKHLDWDTWNHYMTRNHAGDVSRAFGLDDGSGSQIKRGVTSVDEQMRGLGANRKRVAVLAREAADNTGAWAAQIQGRGLDRPRLDELMAKIAKRQTEVDSLDLSDAAQAYDALASLCQTRLQFPVAGAGSGPGGDQLKSVIGQLYDDLAAQKPTAGSDRSETDRVQQRLQEVLNLLPSERAAK